MMTRLTIAERQSAMVVSGLVALAGFTMAIVGHGDPMGVHGWIALLFAGALFFIELYIGGHLLALLGESGAKEVTWMW